jgi:hypothetical protein
MIPVLALWTFAATTLVAADAIPRLDVETHCREIAGITSPAAGKSAAVDACVHDERNAHDQLVKQWEQFAASERSNCVQLATMAATGTYTHLLTCLELARDAKRLHEQSRERTGEMPR